MNSLLLITNVSLVILFTYAQFKSQSKILKTFLLYLAIGLIAEVVMHFTFSHLKNTELTWEIRYLYGLFDTAFLLWFPLRYSNLKRRRRWAFWVSFIGGGIWWVFLILHYLDRYDFPVGLMESSANVIMVLVVGFVLLMRAEITTIPLVNSFNLILTGLLLYLFCTVLLFGIPDTLVRDKMYYLHDIFHLIRDLFFIAAFYFALRPLQNVSTEI